MTNNKSHWITSLCLGALLLTMCSCLEIINKMRMYKGKCKMDITKADFGMTPDGRHVDVYRLTNAHNLEVQIITYGGTVISLKIPDRDGNLGDIVLGHDHLEAYLNRDTHPYFGCLVGRYGNRIAKGKFSIDSKEYILAINNGPNHLHGGNVGFDQAVWQAEPIKGNNEVALKLSHTSPDGDEGYPGNLSMTVIYSLTNDNEFKIDYKATTDKPTLCNLTNHSYYNFTEAKRNHHEHEIMINADRFTPVDADLIPTGELRPVAGTPFDLTKPTPIGKGINANDEQIKYGPGYDHNWVLNKDKPGKLTLAARVYESTTGRYMEVWTTEPGLQFYSGNFLDGSFSGKGDIVYKKHYGFCLETQHWPDSPNQPEWPTTVLRPGQTYKSTTIHKFSVK